MAPVKASGAPTPKILAGGDDSKWRTLPFTIMSLLESQREPPGLSSAAQHNFSKGFRLKSLKVPTGVWGQDPIKQPYHTAGHNCVVENSEQQLLDKRI